ncbi:hypothetical protein COV56_00325 [Candidatus Kuenenbacteria bacterium CG11_big_fil_rev_8_21_14_0_20_37_9]|uniref:Glycosyltransferase RgtA/B/C/D-like domain-containing protein n=2 Tax=Candidatus Kueneniibacteriota TaxID=1752740 RepID=A0A2M6XSG2_9BACT|nr:MAG: hypothetical protein AUJ29_00575 [Candidatus Kuenenbacteria bacterium CG1_02_38_13]PIR05910.1 MAG: hypothetical protein COV56_00325 [Candidatus Kuenenbacteria bacterium CG11_big_fil_rev_8_21_14_0_20_37_9]PIU10585.1 MAG: hypothetical protein COT27_02345 [Candidatus Kuenenbacteria bacterium CG08_land_8_20_14_0_20_37_23]
MKFKKTILILLLIIFIAMLFRLSAVLSSKSFWFDEVVSIEIAKKGIIESWQYLKWENNPPLHYWFLHWWIKLFGAYEIPARLSSLLFSIFGVIAIYFLGRKLISRRVGLIASFLIAISVLHISLSQDARMYPMLFFFAIVSCYYFWEIMHGRRNRINWFLYILSTVLAYYTHILGLFLFVIQNIYFIYKHYFLPKDREIKKLWIYSQAVSVGLFLPWLYFFIIKAIILLNGSAWYFHTSGGGFFLLEIPRGFLFLGAESPIIEFVGLIFFGIFLTYSLVRVKEWSAERMEFKVEFTIQPATVFCWLIFLVPLMAGFIIQLWVIKYYAISSIGFFLLVATGISNLKIVNKYRFALICMIFMMSLPYNFIAITSYGQHQWANAADYVLSKEKIGDKIFIPAFIYKLPFDYYYKGNVEVIGYEPLGLESDLLFKTVKYNWCPIISKENMPDIGEVIGNAQRVIVIYSGTIAIMYKTDLVLDWFTENDWDLETREEFGGFANLAVLIFRRPGDE